MAFQNSPTNTTDEKLQQSNLAPKVYQSKTTEEISNMEDTQNIGIESNNSLEGVTKLSPDIIKSNTSNKTGTKEDKGSFPGKTNRNNLKTTPAKASNEDKAAIQVDAQDIETNNNTPRKPEMPKDTKLIASPNDKVSIHENPLKSEDSNENSVLLISLGGGEDEVFAARSAQLLSLNGYKVTVLAYGPNREVTFPNDIQVHDII